MLSLFDGISGGQIALERAGIKVDNYYASEIEPNAIKITHKNYPNTIQIGNVENVSYKDGVLYSENGEFEVGEIDLLIGGSPCTGLSLSGKLLNFDDPRSKLYFEFERLLNEVNPKYFLLENVKMQKESEDVITKGTGVEPILINSNLVSAQNRSRLYWTNIPNVTQPEDRNIQWEDIKEHGELDTLYTQGDKKIIIPNNGEQGLAAMRGRYVFDEDLDKKITKQFIEFRKDNKTNTLTTVRKDNIAVPYKLPNKVLASEFYYRYLTVLECERLQTLPEGYTEGVKDSHRFKMIGNGWNIDTVAHIFKGLKET